MTGISRKYKVFFKVAWYLGGIILNSQRWHSGNCLEIPALCHAALCREISFITLHHQRPLQSLDRVSGSCTVIYNEPLQVMQGTY